MRASRKSGVGASSPGAAVQRNRKKPEEARMERIERILVPVDFSEHSSKALDTAIGLAKVFGAKITLLHCYQINVGGVSPYGLVIPESLDRDVRDAASGKLAEWRSKVEAAGVEADDLVTPIFPSEAICNQAEEMSADLIVMGTRGLTGVRHVLLGSVAERTIRTAPCPVLTVKAEVD
jgi:nucleotide-binding universal stress UspA family protein